jgi:hypothetical protein
MAEGMGLKSSMGCMVKKKGGKIIEWESIREKKNRRKYRTLTLSPPTYSASDNSTPMVGPIVTVRLLNVWSS